MILTKYGAHASERRAQEIQKILEIRKHINNWILVQYREVAPSCEIQKIAKLYLKATFHSEFCLSRIAGCLDGRNKVCHCHNQGFTAQHQNAATTDWSNFLE